jgi:hypothetical protein
VFVKEFRSDVIPVDDHQQVPGKVAFEQLHGQWASC